MMRALATIANVAALLICGAGTVCSVFVADSFWQTIALALFAGASAHELLRMWARPVTMHQHITTTRDVRVNVAQEVPHA